MQYESEKGSVYKERFVVRTYETCINNRITLPAYSNLLQEAAAKHVRMLGRGTSGIANIGYTWILSRLHMVVSQYVRWRDEVTVISWPSGIRERTTALRDFIIEDQWGNPILECVSEWFYMDVRTMRISPLPDFCNRFSSSSIPRAEVPETSGNIPGFLNPSWKSTINVRKSDHDFNHHVNHSHYIEWLFEPIPKEWRANREIRELDISFKAGTRQGDTLSAETVQEMDNELLHRLRLESDDSTLVTARTRWDEG